jgi:hypothetical protein
MGETNRRVAAIRKAVFAKIVDEDALGLGPEARSPFVGWGASDPGALAESLTHWVRALVARTLLGPGPTNPTPLPDSPTAPASIPLGSSALLQEGIGGEKWWDQYLADAYKLGAGRVYSDLHPDEGDGFRLGASDKAEFLRLLMQGRLPSQQTQFTTNAARLTPQVRGVSGQFISEQAQALSANVGKYVKNVSDQLAERIARDISNGIEKGLSPEEIAKAVSKSTGWAESRCATIARTETVRAAAEAQLDAAEALGVTEISVAAEWVASATACPLCAPLGGVVLKVSEARGLLPRHPSCQCAYVLIDPVKEKKARGKALKTGKGDIDRAFKKSTTAEVGKGGSPNQSRWAGAGQKVDRLRPGKTKPPTVKAGTSKTSQVKKQALKKVELPPPSPPIPHFLAPPSPGPQFFAPPSPTKFGEALPSPTSPPPAPAPTVVPQSGAFKYPQGFKKPYDFSGPNPLLGTATRPELTLKEAEALQGYAWGGHINERLRAGKSLWWGGESKNHKLLQEAFAKAKPLDSPITVYRGMGFKNPADAAKFIKSIEGAEDGIVRLPGYTSTSTNHGFAGDVQIEIKAIHGLDVRPYSKFTNEDELLLNHNSQFRVVSVEKVQGPSGETTHIKLEQIYPPKDKAALKLEAEQVAARKAAEELARKEAAEAARKAAELAAKQAAEDARLLAERAAKKAAEDARKLVEKAAQKFDKTLTETKTVKAGTSKTAQVKKGKFKHPDGFTPPKTSSKPNPSLPGATRPTLTLPEANAARDYSDVAYKQLNADLRDGSPVSTKVKAVHEDLQKAFGKAAPLDEPVTVFRGMTFTSVEDRQALLDSLANAQAAGEPIRVPGYTSTSTSKTKAFPGGVRLEIQARHGIDLAPYSKSPSELEFLLNHNSQFRVVSIESVPGKPTLVKLEQIFPPVKPGTDRVLGKVLGSEAKSSGVKIPEVKTVKAGTSKTSQVKKTAQTAEQKAAKELAKQQAMEAKKAQAAIKAAEKKALAEAKKVEAAAKKAAEKAARDAQKALDQAAKKAKADALKAQKAQEAAEKKAQAKLAREKAAAERKAAAEAKKAEAAKLRAEKAAQKAAEKAKAVKPPKVPKTKAVKPGTPKTTQAKKVTVPKPKAPAKPKTVKAGTPKTKQVVPPKPAAVKTEPFKPEKVTVSRVPEPPSPNFTGQVVGKDGAVGYYKDGQVVSKEVVQKHEEAAATTYRETKASIPGLEKAANDAQKAYDEHVAKKSGILGSFKHAKEADRLLKKLETATAEWTKAVKDVNALRTQIQGSRQLEKGFHIGEALVNDRASASTVEHLASLPAGQDLKALEGEIYAAAKRMSNGVPGAGKDYLEARKALEAAQKVGQEHLAGARTELTRIVGGPDGKAVPTHRPHSVTNPDGKPLTSPGPDQEFGAKAGAEFVGKLNRGTMIEDRVAIGESKGGRAFYNAGDNTVFQPAEFTHTPEAHARTMVHELGHWLEANKPGVMQEVQAFIEHRFGNEVAVDLSTIPGNEGLVGEFGKKDQFDRVFEERRAYYVGKSYVGIDGTYQGSEIVSMGIEALYENPVAFCRKDPEFAQFIIRILSKE